MNIKIIVINLKSSSGRRARISKQLDTLGIPYEFLEATEGSALTDDWIERNIGNRLRYTCYNNIHYSVNKNAFACADSHRRAQIIAAEFEDGYTLILEDDVELSSDFKKKLTHAVELMQDYSLHVAFPGYNWARGSFEKRNDVKCSGLSFSFYKYPADGHVSGSYSYIVDSLGAKKLVTDNLDKIEDTADWFYIKEKGIIESTVVLYPKLITTGYFESDIVGSSDLKVSLIGKSKRMIYSLSVKSKYVRNTLRYWKERRL
ncbi:glycosyltransferase family 25 protein [Psychrobacter sp. APC 3426]|uniref:glycosyltransferase family 25 protein n=1 Tax=Psychrobacter sp. APC 3426 TaxID=3035177 RepID=UPI0025B2F297|nr:glycosyltransferase family 25 protein [Psychrobacter sp. APC 3426]MDN3399806.1 glycosyltransferase family 25 protein [Psychrobacter sp. APC 3426]